MAQPPSKTGAGVALWLSVGLALVLGLMQLVADIAGVKADPVLQDGVRLGIIGALAGLAGYLKARE